VQSFIPQGHRSPISLNMPVGSVLHQLRRPAVRQTLWLAHTEKLAKAKTDTGFDC
jgi:hypothetical protein